MLLIFSHLFVTYDWLRCTDHERFGLRKQKLFHLSLLQIAPLLEPLKFFVVNCLTRHMTFRTSSGFLQNLPVCLITAQLVALRNKDIVEWLIHNPLRLDCQLIALFVLLVSL